MKIEDLSFEQQLEFFRVYYKESDMTGRQLAMRLMEDGLKENRLGTLEAIGEIIKSNPEKLPYKDKWISQWVQDEIEKAIAGREGTSVEAT